MDEVKDHLFALIFCGGGGTRLWPFSRNAKPKQFLKVRGNRPLVRQTYDRVAAFIPNERIFVVTIPEYTDEVAEMLSEVPRSQVLVEPARKNTAMAAGLGAIAISKKDPQAIIANIWADHLIDDDVKYKKAILAGAAAAANGENLVTTGIAPRYPHAGLGYVKKGRVYDVIDDVDVYKVEKFTEKPKLAEAKRMIASGGYLWHQGTFIWRFDAFMKALEDHSRALYQKLKEISKYYGKDGAKDKVNKVYQDAKDMSIDVALAEKADNFLITEANFDWYDLGDFSVLWQVEEKDSKGNSIILDEEGDFIGIDTQESMIVAEGKKVVATIGLTDMIVVSTPDATLVAPKALAQKVKQIVEEIKKRKKKEFL
jgi:mannose-1-phosphate guanylyltransferase